MERTDEPKTYTVYKITSPRGKVYVGFTSQDLETRWQQHKANSIPQNAQNRLMVKEIKEFNGDGFAIEGICKTHSKELAMKAEEEYIAKIPSGISLNMTRGGRYDGIDGNAIFWDRLNADPERRLAYLKKLSETKKRRDWTDYDALQNAHLEWRRLNPRQAYKNAYRAIRLATKTQGNPPPCRLKEDTRPLKERLMHKFNLNEVKRQYVTEVWANRSDEEKKQILEKISAKQQAHMASLTYEERQAATAKARASIDREKQGEAASSGLKNWWAELRKDPERYQAYIEQRKKTFKERQRNANL